MRGNQGRKPGTETRDGNQGRKPGDRPDVLSLYVHVLCVPIMPQKASFVWPGLLAARRGRPPFCGSSRRAVAASKDRTNSLEPNGRPVCVLLRIEPRSALESSKIWRTLPRSVTWCGTFTIAV